MSANRCRANGACLKSLHLPMTRSFCAQQLDKLETEAGIQREIEDALGKADETGKCSCPVLQTRSLPY